MTTKKIFEYPLPEGIIEFKIPEQEDENGDLYKKGSFEYEFIEHFCNGKPIPDFSKFVEVREHFQNYGCYSNAIINTHPQSAYMKFWKREEDRCLNGCTIDKIFIPGYLYWYCNYTPIIRIKVIGKDKKSGKEIGEKTYDFPDIYDTDYFWYWYLDECEKRGLHAGNIKARRKGFSFKGSSMMTRNFYLIPNSKSYAVADNWDYLTKKDGLLVKVAQHMGFIDEHTAWYKRRDYKNVDTHRRATYKKYLNGNVPVESGYWSEIIGISLDGDVDKMRGISGKLILWEESGNNRVLQLGWEVAKGSMQIGNVTHGLMVSWGTGGSEGADFTGLERMVRNPHEFDIFGIPNIWEFKKIRNKIAFFVPDFISKQGYSDPKGNSDILGALQYELQKRENLKGNPMMLRQHIAEYPFTVEEATLSTTTNTFDIALIREQLAELVVNPIFKGNERVGKMILKGDGSPIFKIDTEVRPLTQFPTTDKDPNGAVIIYEMPYIDSSGKVPFGMYLAGTDPVDLNRDDVGDKYSLASTIIMNKLTRRIVAEYTGRTRRVEEYYENLRLLLEYYNAQTLFEANLVGMYKYFERANSLYLLADTPSLFKDKFMVKGIGKDKGIKSDSRGQIKAWGRELINQWSSEIIEEEALNGQVVKKYNIHRVRCKPLLEEMRDWTKEGNFDRVDAFCYAMILIEDRCKITIEREQSHTGIMHDPYWNVLLGKKKKTGFHIDEKTNTITRI